MAEVDDDDDAWQEPKSTRQIGGNIVDEEREELDEENLVQKLRERDLTNAGGDEENERRVRGGGRGGGGGGGEGEEERGEKKKEDRGRSRGRVYRERRGRRGR